MMHFFCAVGDSIEESEAEAYLQNLFGNGLISDREYQIIRAATSNASLSGVAPEKRSAVRAALFKQILLSLMAV